MFRYSLLLAIIVVITTSGEIAIHSQFAFMPEITDQYSVVRTTLYPLTQRAQQQFSKDYFVKKWQSAPPPPEAKGKAPTISIIKVEQAQRDIIFEGQPHSISIITKTPKMVKIQDYFAVTTVYPSAIQPYPQVIQKTITPQIQIPPAPQIQVAQKPNPPQKLISGDNELIEERKRVDNQNKQIDWKLKNPSSPSNIIIDKNKQIALTNTFRQSETVFIAQVGGYIPVASSIAMTQPPEPIISQSTKKTTPSTLSTDQLNYKDQLQRLKYKNHKWIIVVIILLVVILFLGFLFMRYNRSRSDLWNDFKNKLQTNNSQAVQEQQEADFNPHQSGNELIQQE